MFVVSSHKLHNGHVDLKIDEATIVCPRHYLAIKRDFSFLGNRKQ